MSHRRKGPLKRTSRRQPTSSAVRRLAAAIDRDNQLTAAEEEVAEEAGQLAWAQHAVDAIESTPPAGRAAELLAVFDSSFGGPCACHRCADTEATG